MKWLLFLILFISGVAVWLYFDSAARQQWLGNTPLAPAASVTTVYKWRDDQGNWQITDQLPPAGTEYERLEYHGDTNVMPLAPQTRQD